MKNIRVKLLFAWYDLWMGVYIDKAKARLYIFPVPCFGIVVSALPEGHSIGKVTSYWAGQGIEVDTYVLRREDGTQVGAFDSYVQAVYYGIAKYNNIKTKQNDAIN